MAIFNGLIFGGGIVVILSLQRELLHVYRCWAGGGMGTDT